MRGGQITSQDFPVRRHPGGWPLCRFCGAGVVPPRRNWCGEACVKAYTLIVDPTARCRALVAARFGTWAQARCAQCARTDREIEDSRVDRRGFGADIPWVPTLKETAAYLRQLWDMRSNLEMDHIVELADGGCWWSTWNLQLLCRDCHQQKTAASARARAARRRSAREVAA